MVNDIPEGFPKWLDKFYFNDILRKDYGQFKIVRFNVAPANPKGENYASLMYRVKLTVENTGTGIVHRNFIVKVNHAHGMSQEIMEIFNVFPKEIEMYVEYIPKFEELYKKAGETVRFGPNCIVGTREPQDLIIMDDLCLEGFKCADRVKGLDWDHVQLTIGKLAKFHAASAAFLDKGGVFDKKFDRGIFSEHMRPMFEQIFGQNQALMKEVMATWKCSKIIDKFWGHWKELMIDRIFEMAIRDETKFCVLLHGDLWCNNVMFKYDEGGKATDCLLVDYQICNYNSPVMDLLYFIYSSTQHDVKMNRVDEIIQLYHRELVANLKKLGYSKKPPTLLDLQKDFMELGLFGVSATFGTLSIAVAPPPPENAAADSFFKDDDIGRAMKRALYTNPVWVNALEDLVPYFDRKGYFDL